MKKDIINELKSDANIYAECPTCGEAFPLSTAIMFRVEGPIPEDAKQLIEKKKKDIKNRWEAILNRRNELKERSKKATVSVNIGKILEKVAPAIKGFKFDPHDCRALFEPIDYIIFKGLTSHKGIVDSISFVDIKTGGALLTKHQKRIKEAVKSGKVAWDCYRGWL